MEWGSEARVGNMGWGNTTRGWGILQGDGNTRGFGYYRGSVEKRGKKKILEEVWRLMIPFHLHWHRTLLCTYLIINMKNVLSFCDFHADIWF